jgi:hypothetical protein
MKTVSSFEDLLIPFLVTDVLNRVTPPIKPDQNLATRGEEHGILLVLI